MLRKTSTMKWYGLLLLIAVVLVLVLPPPHGLLYELQITQTEFRLAISSLILPFAIIWFSAFYAYNSLRLYATQIQSTKEGNAFKNIANGTGILAWGLAITTILAILFNAITDAFPGFTQALQIINNYISILVPLIGFSFMVNGTHTLNVIAKLRPSLADTRIIIFVFLIIGVFFTHLIMDNIIHRQNPYYLSHFLLMLTFVIPYLYAWFIGLLSANEIRLYGQAIKGIIYKKALIQLASGLAIVIISSIATQFISSVFLTSHSLPIGLAFLLTYPVLIIEAVGYGLVAYGALCLKRIEEV
jgi:hypothetical protein